MPQLGVQQNIDPASAARSKGSNGGPVLITGYDGAIGSALAARLRPRYRVIVGNHSALNTHAFHRDIKTPAGRGRLHKQSVLLGSRPRAGHANRFTFVHAAVDQG